jgi:hypothetical protein
MPVLNPQYYCCCCLERRIKESNKTRCLTACGERARELATQDIAFGFAVHKEHASKFIHGTLSLSGACSVL